MEFENLTESSHCFRICNKIEKPDWNFVLDYLES